MKWSSRLETAVRSMTASKRRPPSGSDAVRIDGLVTRSYTFRQVDICTDPYRTSNRYEQGQLELKLLILRLFGEQTFSKSSKGRGKGVSMSMNARPGERPTAMAPIWSKTVEVAKPTMIRVSFACRK